MPRRAWRRTPVEKIHHQEQDHDSEHDQADESPLHGAELGYRSAIGNDMRRDKILPLDARLRLPYRHEIPEHANCYLKGPARILRAGRLRRHGDIRIIVVWKLLVVEIN